jgi:sugar diacid utilization regulator
METELDALKENKLSMEDIVLDPIRKNSYHISESVLKQMDKAKRVKEMYKSPKHYEYDPHLNGLHEPGSNQVVINQALNDRIKTLEAHNSALIYRLKQLETIITSKNFTNFSEKLEEFMDKLDDLKSRVDLLDE